MISTILTTIRLTVFLGSLSGLLGHPSPAPELQPRDPKGNNLLSPEYGVAGLGGEKGLAGAQDITQLTKMAEMEAVGSRSSVDNSGKGGCGKYKIIR